MKKRIRITIEVDTMLQRPVFNRLVMDAVANHAVFQECVYAATEIVEIGPARVLVNLKRAKKPLFGR